MVAEVVAARAAGEAGDAGVVRVTLRHTGRLNAMSRAMWRQLREVFDGIQRSADVVDADAWLALQQAGGLHQRFGGLFVAQVADHDGAQMPRGFLLRLALRRALEDQLCLVTQGYWQGERCLLLQQHPPLRQRDRCLRRTGWYR